MTQPTRRQLLRLCVGGLVSSQLWGCGLYDPETGEAFEPWNFPGSEARPPWLAARAALLAANPHNTQPWALHVDDTGVDFHADLDRNLGAMDDLRRELRIGVGCALENAVVAARGAGREVDVTLTPEPASPSLMARLTLTTEAGEEPLFPALAKRHSNRGQYADVPAPEGLEAGLRALVEAPVRLHWLAAAEQRAQFRTQTIAATQAIIGDPEMSEASYAWYRQSHEELTASRDGVTLDASGNGAATRTAGKVLARSSRAEADQYWLAGTVNRQTTGSAFVILSSPADYTTTDLLSVGRTYQRLHLWATTQGLAMQPLNQLAERQDREVTQGLEPRFGTALDSLMGETGRRAQMLFRIGYAWDQAYASPRRPLAWVLR